MHPIIHPLKSDRSRSRLSGNLAKQQDLRKPHYDCKEHPESLEITVYVPEVEAAGVEITSHGPDLIVTARKSHFVRVNWQALHLESVQRDYSLVLRLGHTVDFRRMEAEIRQGILSLRLPKKNTQTATGLSLRLAQVA